MPEAFLLTLNMKKLFFIATIFISTCTYSQVFKSGLLIGLTGSQVEGDGYGGYNKLGFIAGGFTNTDFSEKWSTQFEIYYINKGSFDPARPDKGDYSMFKFNVNYIEVPIALRYKHNQFMFETGLYGAKFLSYSVEDQNGPRTINVYPIKSFDFGGFIGINYNITDNFIFNLRSKSSLLPFRDFQSFDQNIGILNKLFNNGWYHLDINFSIRYQFGGKE